MLRIRTDYANHAAPMNDLALHADFLNRCSDFHFPCSIPSIETKSDSSSATGGLRIARRTRASLVAIDDAAAREIVGRKLHGHAISRQNADEVFPHFPGDMGQHLMLVFELDAKHGVRKRLDHRGHHLDGVFFAAAPTKPARKLRPGASKSKDHSS